MTLQSSGTMYLSQIKNEFGGSYYMSQYYAGGAYVPSGTSGVPSSGTIYFSNFYGTSAVRVYLPSQTFIDWRGTAGQAYVEWGYNGDGTTWLSESQNPNGSLGNWINPQSYASQYEVYASYTGTTPTGSSTNTWIPVTNNPRWRCSASNIQNNFCYLSTQMRKIGTSTIVASGTQTLNPRGWNAQD